MDLYDRLETIKARVSKLIPDGYELWSVRFSNTFGGGYIVEIKRKNRTLSHNFGNSNPTDRELKRVIKSMVKYCGNKENDTG